MSLAFSQAAKHKVGETIADFPVKCVLNYENFESNMDFEFDADMRDIARIKRELNKIGLDLVDAERPVKTLFIND